MNGFLSQLNNWSTDTYCTVSSNLLSSVHACHGWSSVYSRKKVSDNVCAQDHVHLFFYPIVKNRLKLVKFGNGQTSWNSNKCKLPRSWKSSWQTQTAKNILWFVYKIIWWMYDHQTCSVPYKGKWVELRSTPYVVISWTDLEPWYQDLHWNLSVTIGALISRSTALSLWTAILRPMLEPWDRGLQWNLGMEDCSESLVSRPTVYMYRSLVLSPTYTATLGVISWTLKTTTPPIPPQWGRHWGHVDTFGFCCMYQHPTDRNHFAEGYLKLQKRDSVAQIEPKGAEHRVERV